MFEIKEEDGLVTLSSVANRLDIHMGAELKSRMEDCLRNYTGEVVFNMTGVAYIDSSIIGVLIHYRKKLSDAGRKFCLTNLSVDVRKIFELTKLIAFFTVK